MTNEMERFITDFRKSPRKAYDSFSTNYNKFSEWEIKAIVRVFTTSLALDIPMECRQTVWQETADMLTRLLFIADC